MSTIQFDFKYFHSETWKFDEVKNYSRSLVSAKHNNDYRLAIQDKAGPPDHAAGNKGWTVLESLQSLGYRRIYIEICLGRQKTFRVNEMSMTLERY